MTRLDEGVEECSHCKKMRPTWPFQNCFKFAQLKMYGKRDGSKIDIFLYFGGSVGPQVPPRATIFLQSY